MQNTISNARTGFILGGALEPTFWAPEKLKSRYEKVADDTRNELRIEKAARDDALHLLPRSDAAELSQTERSIRDRCENALVNEITTIKQEISNYEEVVNQHRATAQIRGIDAFFDNNIDVLTKAARTTLSPATGGAGADLLQAMADRDTAQRELTAFRRERKLTERAKYPASRFMHFFVIVVILVGEAMANSYFFGQGNDLGLLGGFFEAMLFAGINVGLAGLVAFCARYLWHIDQWRKALGAAGILFFGGLMVLVAAVAALYRFQAVNAADVNQLGLLSLPWADLGNAVATKDGILLILLALILGVVAVIDWLAMDDLHPGYGAKQRHLEDIKAYIQERQAEVIEELYSEFLKRMREKEVPRLENILDQLVHGAKNIQKVTSDFNQAVVKQLESCYHGLLKLYREENTLVRMQDTSGSSPPPRYFATYPTLQTGDFDPAEMSRQFARNHDQFTAVLTHFQSKKQEMMGAKYEADLKSAVYAEFERLVDELNRKAIEGNRANEGADLAPTELRPSAP